MVKHDDAPKRVQSSGGLNVSRRTVARGMAWSVPAVAVATAAPAYANHSIPIITRRCGSACKHPGNPEAKDYHFTFCFTNTSTVPITITLTNMIVNDVPGPIISPTGSFVVNAGATVCKYVDAGPYGDSANGVATLNFAFSYTAPDGTKVNDTESFTTAFNDLPPCGTGADPGDNPSDDPPHTEEPSQTECAAPV